MKRFAALLTALLLLCLPISGCSREPAATPAEPSAEADSFELTEETLRRDEDVFSVLIGAVHYDEGGQDALFVADGTHAQQRGNGAADPSRSDHAHLGGALRRSGRLPFQRLRRYRLDLCAGGK